MIQFGHIKKALSIHLAIALAFVASGCASYPGRQLSTITPSQLSSLSKMGDVDYSITWQVQGKDSSIALNYMEKLFAEVFEESDVFASHRLGKGYAPVHLEFIVNNHGNMPLAFVSGLISGFTFLIIPGFAKDEYEMRVNISKEGHLVKQLKYDDSMSTWIGWVLLPFMPNRLPKDVSKEVLGNMIHSAILDLQKEGILFSE